MIRTLYRLWHGFDPIPESEIGAESRRILIEHSADPTGYASGVVERLQCSKNGREIVKAERVLRALEKITGNKRMVNK